jgi:hypothetical protein
MKNKERVEREIREAVEHIDCGAFASHAVAEAACRCVELEGEHARAQININQQVDRLIQGILDGAVGRG